MGWKDNQANLVGILSKGEREQNQALLVTGAVQYLKYHNCYRQIES